MFWLNGSMAWLVWEVSWVLVCDGTGSYVVRLIPSETVFVVDHVVLVKLVGSVEFRGCSNCRRVIGKTMGSATWLHARWLQAIARN